MSQIVAFSGSSRRDSYNRRLLEFAVEGSRAAGAEVTVVDLAELNLPLFSQDLEEAHGLPENARRFKQQLIEAEGLLIASPEYNSSITPLLKNAIDWASRAESEGEPALQAFRGKTAAILAASPGGYGGSRSLETLRKLLENIKVNVLPQQVTAPKVHEHFSDDGKFQNAELQQAAHDLGAALARKLNA